MEADTIFAVASGAGYAAIAVMRISGPASHAALAALCGRVPPPRRASLRRLRDCDGAELDQAMVVWLPGPGSYTGEDSAELFLHGGRAVLDGVADALVRLGARPAEAGEFTRRAFLNGRMDLTEAEAVHDLVAAETAAQRRQALRQLDGALGTIYRDWADRLRILLAQQEALIDFPDEDLPPEVEAAVQAELAALRAEVAAHLNDGRRGERLREGLVFAVTGRPNVGKSSLVNALAERDVAIVSATPGTTRDALETRVVLGGVPVTLVDTAGLRDSTDAIEAEGVRRALARAADADLVVVVTEAGGQGEVQEGEKTPPPLAGGGWGEGAAPVPVRPPPPNPLPQGEGEHVVATSCLLVMNKLDLGRRRPTGRNRRQRADRRGPGHSPRAPGRGGPVIDPNRRPAAAHPGQAPCGAAGSGGPPHRRGHRRTAGVASRGPASGATGDRSDHRQRRRGGHPRHAVLPVLHRQVGRHASVGRMRARDG